MFVSLLAFIQMPAPSMKEIIMNAVMWKNTDTTTVNCLKPGTIAETMKMVITTTVASHRGIAVEAVTKENTRLIIVNHIIHTRYV